ncbi:response regulator transcription factor [Cohnella abietis]|uniref:DNA-binding response regulator n=1 Tax=Cohnella abietis TaxID=2507935 RepID=A0A3T1DEP4_9BACL|nr:response regulator transcription factor [Cohnella abietis]BBI36494.1 DNA-binding response regulator [Cohnella abietis]
MLKVLIVDDEPIILEGLTNIVNWNELGLEIAGCCVNGAEAVTLLEKINIDIVITDIKMPEMNGIDLIRHIKQQNWNTRCIVLSSYDDFQYVKEAALLSIENYLLKPVSTLELIATLENLTKKIESEQFTRIERQQEKNILRTNVVYRWMTDDIDKKELETRASLLDIQLHQDSFLVAMIKIAYDDKKIAQYKIKDKKLLRFAANNICNELVSQHADGMSIIDMNGDIAIIIYQETGLLNIQNVHEVLEKCIEHIHTLLDIDVFVTVGSIQRSYRQVPLSYTQAKNIQKLQLIYSYNHIVHYEDAAPFMEQDITMPRLDYDKLRVILSAKDKTAIQPYFEEVSSQLRDRRHFAPEYITNAVLGLTLHIEAVVEEISPKSNDFFKDTRDIFQGVYRLDTIEEMITSLQEIAYSAIDYFMKYEEQISPIIRLVLTYIEKHYADNIDLKQIAQEYKMTPLYLGQCFKKDVGEPFTQYVNKIRIDKAKELLRNTSLKTNEIAEKVGYINVNYFPTIFRKLVGVTPSIYQKKTQ